MFGFDGTGSRKETLVLSVELFEGANNQRSDGRYCMKLTKLHVLLSLIICLKTRKNFLYPPPPHRPRASLLLLQAVFSDCRYSLGPNLGASQLELLDEKGILCETLGVRVPKPVLSTSYRITSSLPPLICLFMPHSHPIPSSPSPL